MPFAARTTFALNRSSKLACCCCSFATALPKQASHRETPRRDPNSPSRAYICVGVFSYVHTDRHQPRMNFLGEIHSKFLLQRRKTPFPRFLHCTPLILRFLTFSTIIKIQSKHSAAELNLTVKLAFFIHLGTTLDFFHKLNPC